MRDLGGEGHSVLRIRRGQLYQIAVIIATTTIDEKIAKSGSHCACRRTATDGSLIGFGEVSIKWPLAADSSAEYWPTSIPDRPFHMVIFDPGKCESISTTKWPRSLSDGRRWTITGCGQWTRQPRRTCTGATKTPYFFNSFSIEAIDVPALRSVSRSSSTRRSKATSWPIYRSHSVKPSSSVKSGSTTRATSRVIVLATNSLRMLVTARTFAAV